LTAAATLNAHHLARLIRAVAPHSAVEGMGLDRIDGIRFDSDHTTLHAVATDIHSLAVARARLARPTAPFARTVHGQDLPALRAWADAHLETPPYGEAPITLTTAPGHLVFDGPRGTLRVPAADDEKYASWRQLLSSALNDTPVDDPATAWTSQLWGRWQHANRSIHTWHRAPDKALIVLGTDMIGLQMPHRPPNPDRNQAHTPADTLQDWKTSIGTATGERIELADAVPALTRPSLTAAHTVHELTEDLLRQTLNANSPAPSGEHAWTAFRLLRALKRTDPDLAADVVAELGEELDSGEIVEWAWDAALDAGHDPQEWAHERARAAELSSDNGATTTQG
jgi:hypothetical protein